MKTLVLAASLLIFPTLAMADFVADCKTAYVQGDLGARINSSLGINTDMNKAEKPFASRCECISQSITKPYDVDVFLAYIQYKGRVSGPPQSDLMHAARSINQCETKISNEARQSYVKKAQSQKEMCMNSFIQKAPGSPQDKQAALADYKYASNNGGKWTVATNVNGRTIAIDAFTACY